MGGFDFHLEHRKAQWGEEEEVGGGSWRGAANLSWWSPAWSWTVTIKFTGVKVYTMCYCLLTMSSIRIKLFNLLFWLDRRAPINLLCFVHFALLNGPKMTRIQIELKLDTNAKCETKRNIWGVFVLQKGSHNFDIGAWSKSFIQPARWER